MTIGIADVFKRAGIGIGIGIGGIGIDPTCAPVTATEAKALYDAGEAAAS